MVYNLCLTFRGGSNLSKEEMAWLKDYFSAIQSEFDAFKDELQDNHISTEGFTAIIENKQLTIQIPNQKYYELFMVRLMNQNLLPSPNMRQQKTKEDDVVTQSSYRSPNPFDISQGPRPRG